MHLSAATRSQTLSLTVRNRPLSDVFQQIKDQTDLVVVYNELFVNPETRVSISVQRAPLTKTLEALLDPLALTYHITENTIVITAPQRENRNAPVAKLPRTQQRTIAGRITDEQGNPLEGVTVAVKGTAAAAMSDRAGNYRISVPDDGGQLLFTALGFESIERAIGPSPTIDVSMKTTVSDLDEVVVIGYGTAYRRDLTGAVSSINAEKLKDMPVTSIAEALTGRIAGMQVTKAEGAPDATINIRVRGGGSVTQDNSPLFLVDGFPVDNIDDISPMDIQKIDILKDASSTAIYGARGANGVILVTTKSGAEGKGKIGYTNYLGFKNVTKKFDLLDPYEFVLWAYESHVSKGTPQGKYGDFRDFDLYRETAGRDWQEEVLGRTGSNMSHNLSFSGGTNATKFNISVTRNDQNEVMVGSGFSRTNVAINISQKINDWLTIDVKPRLADTHFKGAGTNGGQFRLTSIVQYRPVNGLVDIVDQSEIENLDELDPSSEYAFNPVDMINDDYRRSRNQLYNFSGAANVKLSKNLSYNFSYGSQYEKRANDRFYGLNTYNTYRTGRPAASVSAVDMTSYRVANTVTYSRSDLIAKDRFSFMAGQELNSLQLKTLTNTLDLFPRDIDPVSALGMIQLAEIQNSSALINTPVRVSSFFGRVSYDLLSRYNLTGTVRADGSSKFAPGNQWGYFPSMGFGWNISEEPFFATPQWLSYLKMRVSVGAAGNNRITDNAWQKSFSVQTGSIYMGGDQTIKTPFLRASNILSNEDLTWETTISRNLGLDFQLFKAKVSGNIDIYKNSTRDLLIRAILPTSSGYQYQWQNIGETSNRGIELSLDANIVNTRDFTLSASFNIGFNRNRIERLGEAKSWLESSSVLTPGAGGIAFVDDYFIAEGGEVGQMYGFVTDGMYTFDDFTYDEATTTYTLKEGIADNRALIGALWFGPGTMKLKDFTGDNIVDEHDKVVIGRSNPKHTGGFVINAKYKGVDFSSAFNWVYGNDIYNANNVWFTSLNGGYRYRNLLSTMNSANRFLTIDPATGNNVTDPAALAELNRDATAWSPYYTTPRLNTSIVEDGSFLRLNTLTIGYTFPKAVMNKIRVNQLRIYATGYNLWTWTNYSGYDPEVSTRANPLTPGMDWQAYPRNRSFNFGMNIEF